jgi:hypothetical protein
VVEVKGVATFSADLLNVDQSGGLQPLQVSGGSRPRVAESIGELTCRHRASSGVERHQDVAPMLIGECCEDCLEFVELAQTLGSRDQIVSFTAK